ncbi:N-6 DNA methylase [Microbacterium sp. AZCO]|uniref:N-6 DNA methylase n=1 Tax=Microbacterium sp. AZCO TaxID=3142976 RepID=UPI0031F43914
MSGETWGVGDSAKARKARGAFFTPEPITRFMAEWALRSPGDTVLEPSAGDAAFLVEAIARLKSLGVGRPVVDGVEIHPHSAAVGAARAEAAGGEARITVSDFFLVPPSPEYDAVIGNPPYVRYQDWTGQARARSRRAAFNAGVALTGLASSWASFTVQSALFLREGGRLGLVLPAELLSVNYAAPVRKFLFERFSDVELVLFEKQVFEEAEADTLILLASGYGLGPTDHAVIRQVFDADHLRQDVPGVRWTPEDPAGKWVNSVSGSAAADLLRGSVGSGTMTPLAEWGDTTLGMVTGNNRYFAMSPARASELGLSRSDVIPLSPPGSAHLRGLALTPSAMTRLGRDGRSTRLFRPAAKPSRAAEVYVAAGETAGVSEAYKCRVRSPWWRVPLQRPADLLLTYMNADAARIVTNEAGAHHLNSVHGVYLRDEYRTLGRDLLPVASLNSATMLSAELVGRSYGGGILKVEPREADRWLMPSRALIEANADVLRALKTPVLRRLQTGRLRDAVELVDRVLFRSLPHADMATIRAAHLALQSRRTTRGKRG